MRYLKYLAIVAILVAFPAVHSQAQVAIGVGINIGPNYGIYNAPPVCEYGFYPYYPYACAPYGYWGPSYFVDGVFIGVGPWSNFYFTHPVYYRPFYFNRGFGFHRFGGFRPVERVSVVRFHEPGFRSFGPRGPVFHDRVVFHDNRGFNGGRSFHDSGFRSFHGDGGRNFSHGSNGYRSGGYNFHNGGGYHNGGSYRGGSGFHGGNHGGRR